MIFSDFLFNVEFNIVEIFGICYYFISGKCFLV